MPDERHGGTGNIRLRKGDLQDENLYRVNRKFDLIDERISRLAATLQQVSAAVTPQISRADTAPEVLPTSGTIYGTHAQRLQTENAPSGHLGEFFWETDRNTLYLAQLVSGNAQWVVVWGRMQGTFANIPADLTDDDAGFPYLVTTGTGGVEYYHRIEWVSVAAKWGWGTHETGDHPIQGFPVVPRRGWQYCDGTLTSYFDIVAGVPTEVPFTVPDYVSVPANATYPKFGAAWAASVAAVAAGISGTTTAESAGTPTGTVSQPTLAMDSYTPTGTVSQPTFSGNSQVWTSANVTAAGIVIALTGPNPYTPSGTVSQPTFTGDAATLTGTVSQPTFTGDPLGTHTHDAGTLINDNTGEPQHAVLLPYMRL